MPSHPHVLAPTRRLLSALLLVPALVVGTLAMMPMAPASATPPVGPTVSVTENGDPAADLAVGDVATVTQSAPITVLGQKGQTFKSTWDPAQASLGSDAVTTPEGWSLDYTTDGSSWSSTAPDDLSTVSGVRSSGSVDSNGLDSGLQVSTSSGTGNLQPGASAFNGSGGGDGWDVFFTGDKALNVYHHDGNYNLDCHIRTTGDSCGDVYTASGYQTSGASSGTIEGSKVYSAVVESESNSAGVLCTDTSTSPFTSCGFTPLVSAGTYDWPAPLGSQSRSGNRLYVPVGSGEGQLACFDIDTEAACADQPYALAGFTANWPVPAFTFADSGRVFVTANQIWCFDGASGSACEGSWPAGSSSDNSAIPMRDGEQSLIGVCQISPIGSCYDLGGAAVTMPTGLSDLVTLHPFGEMTGWAQFGFGTSRQYWFTGWGEPPVCYDWLTDSACEGFQQTTSIGYARYSLVVDPADPTCLWSNGDDGVIAPFHAITGMPGCDGPSDPIIVIPYTTAIPRLGCTEEGRIRGWQNLTLVPPAGLATSDLRVTVRDGNGTKIAGFIDMTPDGEGSIDLSGLSVADSGTHPSIKVLAIGASTEDAVAITAAVRYTSDPPQLCVNLTMNRQCPTALTTYESPEVTVSDLAIGGSATADTSGEPTVTPLPASATRAPIVCFGDMNGTVTRSAGGPSTPVAAETVQLIGPDDSVVDTTTTDSDGNYSFGYLVPADYTVRAVSTDGSVTITAGDTATADIVVPVPGPGANPVHGNTLDNAAVTFGINASADPVSTIDLTTLVLSDGDGGWVTTLVVPEQGTWDVVSGRLRFTPLSSFTGRTSDVTYRVADSYASTVSSTAYVNVRPRPASLGNSTLASGGGSVVRWAASPSSSVTRYRMYLDGRLICTTSATSCRYTGLIGPRSRVVVYADGGGGMHSVGARAPYVFTRCSAARDVHFSSASSALNHKARRIIKKRVAIMRSKGFTYLCLVGHTDNVGSAEYNAALSRKRVQAVRANLLRRIQPSWTRIRYLGETAPLVKNGTPDGRAANRRVTIRFG